MPALIFDIETGPLDESELKRILPAFDPASVKHGNTKDEAKKTAQIEAARAEHERKFIDRAALSALTGHVVTVGYQAAGGEVTIDELSEFDTLDMFWHRYRWAKEHKIKMIGWNIFGFDLPFLIRRSWCLGVSVPESLLEKWRYWDPTFIDLMQVWSCGAYGEREKLHIAARFFGHDGKNGDGADFHRLWKEDRPTAIAYLENDLEMTELVATSMGFC